MSRVLKFNTTDNDPTIIVLFDLKLVEPKNNACIEIVTVHELNRHTILEAILLTKFILKKG